MKERWRKTIEKWIIQTDKSFYFELENWKKFFKDIEELYLPSEEKLKEWLDDSISTEDKNKQYCIKSREHIEQWLDLCRAIASKEFVDEDIPYYKVLEKIGFPFKDHTMVSKLNKFLKYSLSVLEVSNEMIKDSYEDKKFLDDNFWNEKFRNKLDLEENEIQIWEVKWFDRTFAKNNWKYAGNVSKIWDLTRMMITKSSFQDLTKTASEFIKYAWKLEWVKQIWIEDLIANLFEKAKKPSWYRDAKMMLVLEDWNTVEVQFHLDEYAKVKKYWLELDDDLTNNINNELSFLSKKEENQGYFTDQEKKEIIEIIKNKNLKFPEKFYSDILKIENKEIYENNIITSEYYYKNILKIEDEEYKSNQNKYNEDKSNFIIDDYLYNIQRLLPEDIKENKKENIAWKNTKTKITTIQNCLYDIAAWKMSEKEVNYILTKKDTTI